MLISDWIYNKNKIPGKVLIIATSITLIYYFADLYINDYSYIPKYYSYNTRLINEPDINILSSDISLLNHNIITNTLGKIRLGDSPRQVDREIEEYLESNMSDNVANIFDNNTYIRCVSCMFYKDSLQSISFRIENMSYEDESVNRFFGRRFIPNRYYALIGEDYKDSKISIIEEIKRINTAASFEPQRYYDSDSMLSKEENESWNKTISTISEKYGKPTYLYRTMTTIGSYLDNKTYYWVIEGKIIRLEIIDKSLANLAYIKSSYILEGLENFIKNEAEQKLRLQQEEQQMLQEEQKKKIQDSINDIERTRKAEIENDNILQQTIRDI